MFVSWKKGYDQPRQHIKKQRRYFVNKVCIVHAMVFPVVMYGCESWSIKKAERRRIDAFELWSWRRLLRVPWTARRSNQSILKEIIPECSLEGLMLNLKLQFGHLMQRADSLEKTLLLGKIEGRRRRGWQKMRWLNGITDSTDMSLNKLQKVGMTGKPGVLQSMESQRVRHDWETEKQQHNAVKRGPPGPPPRLCMLSCLGPHHAIYNTTAGSSHFLPNPELITTRDGGHALLQ